MVDSAPIPEFRITMKLLSTKKDLLNIEIYSDRYSMGKAAASIGVTHAQKIIAAKGFVNIIFAAAPSQIEVYNAFLKSDLDFSCVNAFHMDEYIGLAADSPQRFAKYLEKHLFTHAKFKSVNYIDPSKLGPIKECQRYANLLEAFPPDIVFHGIGENGHLAFNDPPVADFFDPLAVKIVNMDSICRIQQVHDGCFASIDEVPKQAITLTIPTLTKPETLLVVTVPGPTKTLATARVAFDEISTATPATILRRHPLSYLVTDSVAGDLIMSAN